MITTIPVAVWSKDGLLRGGLSMILHAAGYLAVSAARSIDELETAIKDRECPSIILTDEVMNSYSVGHLKENFPQSLVVLLLDTSQTGSEVFGALDVAGVLLKSISSEVLVASLHLIVLGERVFSAPMPPRKTGIAIGQVDMPNSRTVALPTYEGEAVEHLSDDPIEGRSKLARRRELSERELQVLSCLVAGQSNKVIARTCGITEATVKVHLKAVLRKTGANNRTQAAVWATSQGPITGVKPMTDVAKPAAAVEVKAPACREPEDAADVESVCDEADQDEGRLLACMMEDRAAVAKSVALR